MARIYTVETQVTEGNADALKVSVHESKEDLARNLGVQFFKTYSVADCLKLAADHSRSIEVVDTKRFKELSGLTPAGRRFRNVCVSYGVTQF